MFQVKRRVSLVVLSAGLLILAAGQAAAAARKQIPAFPGAEGLGAKSVGGRGGRIIEVTNLNTSGPGSLQAACAAKGPRIVVFKVSGRIKGGVGIGNPYITIAGQTAPGDGICISHGPLRIYGHDAIVRYLRVRVGDDPFGPNPENRDALGIGGYPDKGSGYNIIVDHCSFSFGTDENVAVWGGPRGPRDLTIQWCITAEPLLDSLHPKGPHGMGMIIGKSENTISVHHCLFAHNPGRNPYCNLHRSEKPAIVDFRNNVIYNHGRYGCSNFSGNIHVNYVGNFIKMGPDGDKRSPRGAHLYGTKKRGRIYVKNNSWDTNRDGKGDDWLVVGSTTRRGKKPEDKVFRLDKPLPVPPVTTQSPNDAYESVLKYAGCTRPGRDVQDDRIVNEVRNGTGHSVDSQKDVGGWPTYASAAPPADADHDAMPDAWEKRYGFNPKDPSDGPKDLDGDGYTNVEEFLNLTDPTKPDTGAPIPHPPVVVQAGNERIRGENARKFGDARIAAAKKPRWDPKTREAFLAKVKESGKEPAEFLGIKLVRISAGQFKMGTMTVKLTKPYELSACEITQAQWQTVMGTKPWAGQPFGKDMPNWPVNYVNHHDCREFISRLNAAGDRKYRLPTYCEWMWAARGGTDSPFGFGNNRCDAIKYAWCCVKTRDSQKRRVRRSCDSPQDVGQLPPNPYGLYNMAGNVSEWVHDWRAYRYYNAKRYRIKERTDPMGPPSADPTKLKVHCGGHFRLRASNILAHPAANHKPHYRNFDMGFRIRRALP